MSDSGVLSKVKRSRMPGKQYEFKFEDTVAADFIAQMAATIGRLYDEEFGQATEGAKACDYCRFIDFCRRTPSKSW